MASRNYCEFVGNLGKDPEVSVLQNGTKVGKFSLAVNERYKEREETLWLNITTFDKLAEITAQYCRKGHTVLVAGKLHVRNYDRQDGTKGTSVEVIANEVVFLEKKRDAAEPQQPTLPGTNSGGITDEDIPF